MNKIKIIRWLSFIAAFLYSSWIVGYILNPKVAAIGTVSELSALTQPFRDFFMAADVLMIAVILTTALLVLSIAVKTWQKIAVLLYVLFGVLTLVTTFVPLQCAQSVESCAASSQSVSHMFAGTFAFVAMLMSLLVILFYSRIRELTYALVALFLWVSVAVTNTLFVLSGHSGPFVALTQRAFLLLTAVFIALVPLLLVHKSSISNRT